MKNKKYKRRPVYPHFYSSFFQLSIIMLSIKSLILPYDTDVDMHEDEMEVDDIYEIVSNRDLGTIRIYKPIRFSYGLDRIRIVSQRIRIGFGS